MRFHKASTDERTSSLPVKLDLTLHRPLTAPSLSAMWHESVSTVNPVELVDELAQAYAASLRLQNVLRPLVPRTTWYQAAGAAYQWSDNWPVEELVATIMFTDIAGFSTLMEAHPVKDVLTSLNEYLTLLSQIVQHHRGDVHKFLGDGLMALFIDPADAVQAGSEIQRVVGEFNVRQSTQGLWCFETRLAIDTGDVILTIVGSIDRQDYTLIGRPVNLAAHLSEKSTPGTVWISKSTFDKLVCKCGFAPRPMPKTQNQREPPIVYEMTCL